MQLTKAGHGNAHSLENRLSPASCHDFIYIESILDFLHVEDLCEFLRIFFVNVHFLYNGLDDIDGDDFQSGDKLDDILPEFLVLEGIIDDFQNGGAIQISEGLEVANPAWPL